MRLVDFSADQLRSELDFRSDMASLVLEFKLFKEFMDSVNAEPIDKSFAVDCVVTAIYHARNELKRKLKEEGA